MRAASIYVPVFPPANQLIFQHWPQAVRQGGNLRQLISSQPDPQGQIEADHRHRNPTGKDDSGGFGVAFDVVFSPGHPECATHYIKVLNLRTRSRRFGDRPGNICERSGGNYFEFTVQLLCGFHEITRTRLVRLDLDRIDIRDPFSFVPGPMNLPPAYRQTLSRDNLYVFPSQHLRRPLCDLRAKIGVPINSRNAEQFELRCLGEKDQSKNIIYISTDIGVENNRSHSK